MSQLSAAHLGVGEKPYRRRSPSPSPNRKNKKKAVQQQQYTQELSSPPPVKNDIFNLPTIDYKLMVILTIIATGVRLYRIYQPSSVVFDEVQYEPQILLNGPRGSTDAS